MPTYLEQWKKIAARIRGLIEAGHLHARFSGIRSSDSYGRARRLREQCEQVLHALEDLRNGYRLPIPAKTCVDAFIANHGGLIKDTSGTPDAMEERTWAALVFLGTFDSEFSFLLADDQEIIRAKSELAFAHLQRSIVADPDTRRKWIEAFKEGETSCEKLGAVHLLGHGIYAFKAHGAGERTDLIFQDMQVERSQEPQYATGLVLTEWKVCRVADKSLVRFDEARKQGQRYGMGILGGTELTDYRYAVVVSEKRIEVPSDMMIDSVTYRHINIAVDPDSPSKG